jgi:hypothetical protein
VKILFATPEDGGPGEVFKNKTGNQLGKHGWSTLSFCPVASSALIAAMGMRG